MSNSAAIDNAIVNYISAMEGAVSDPYAPGFAGGSSGLSFGLMQNDVRANGKALQTFETILQNSGIQGEQLQNIITLATTPGITRAAFGPTNYNIASSALAANSQLVSQMDDISASKAENQVASLFAAAETNPNGPGVLNPLDPDPTALAVVSAWANQSGNLNKTIQWAETVTGGITNSSLEAQISSYSYFNVPDAQGQSHPFSSWMTRINDAVSATNLTTTTLPSSGSSSLYSSGTVQAIQILGDGSVELMTQNSCILGTNALTVTDSNGNIVLSIAPSDYSGLTWNDGTVQVSLTTGGTLNYNTVNGTSSYSADGTTYSLGSVISNIAGNLFQDMTDPAGSLGGIGIDYTIGSNGALTNAGDAFMPNPTVTATSITASPISFTTTSEFATSLESSLAGSYTSYTATSAAVNTDIFGSVSPLGSGYGAGGITLADGTDQNYVPGDLVDTGAGLYVEMPIANSLGLFNSAPTNVATDNLQISQGRYMVASQNDPYIIDQQSPYIGGIAFAQTASGLANGANLTADTDPLLIDLTGNGIQVSNWIDNDVYFQSNVTTSGSTESEDTSLHHTSWMESGTGMLVFDPGDTAITNITQTVSEYLNISTNSSAVGSYADGLAALSALATAGSSVFSAATSKIQFFTILMRV